MTLALAYQDALETYLAKVLKPALVDFIIKKLGGELELLRTDANEDTNLLRLLVYTFDLVVPLFREVPLDRFLLVVGCRLAK